MHLATLGGVASRAVLGVLAFVDSCQVGFLRPESIDGHPHVEANGVRFRAVRCVLFSIFVVLSFSNVDRYSKRPGI